MSDAWLLMTPEEARRDRYCKRHAEYYPRHGEQCASCDKEDAPEEDPEDDE